MKIMKQDGKSCGRVVSDNTTATEEINASSVDVQPVNSDVHPVNSDVHHIQIGNAGSFLETELEIPPS